jgi:POT family proton-dependent oligopeptide transporter
VSVLTTTSSLPYNQESAPILGQPRALYTLFFAELWERFSFYGMRALLVLFMTKELLLTNHTSLGILGVYGALLYCSNILGGYLADGFLGNRRAVMLGSVFIILGHLVLTIPMTTFLNQESFYYGLAFLIVGTGFFKPNVSSFLGQFYHVNDPRRDSGFTLFFMGINIGGFLAPLICGTIGEIYGWHYGFGVAALGMILGAFVFYGGKAHFGNVGAPPLQKPSKNFWGGMSALHFILLGISFFVPLMVYVLKSHDHLGEYLTLAGAAVFILIAWIAFRSPAEERKMIFTLLVMFFFVVSFFSIWEQVGGSLLLFTQHNIDRTFFGITIPVSWSQSFSPLCIILLSPLVSYLWTFLNRHNLDPLTPLKFALGFFSAARFLFICHRHSSSH